MKLTVEWQAIFALIVEYGIACFTFNLGMHLIMPIFPLHSYELVISHVCLKLSSSLEYHNFNGNSMHWGAEDKQYKDFMLRTGTILTKPMV